MSTAIGTVGPARIAAWAVNGAAGVVGAWVSYDFGASLGGVLMGVIVAANGAAICSLLASAVLDRLVRRVGA